MKKAVNPKAIGLTAKEFKILNDLVVVPLRISGAKVWLFGSRSRGDYKPFSDIDLLYEFEGDTAEPSGLIFSIKSAVEDSNLPFKVDLVAIKDLAKSFVDQVQKDRLPLVGV